MIVTEREREAETQAEGEAGSMHREPDVGFDPGSPGSRSGPKAGTKLLRHPGIPKVETLITDFRSFFLIYAFNYTHFSLSSALTTSHKFWYVVVFIFFSSRYFEISLEISSLTHVLFRSMLFNLQVFGDFPDIFVIDI